MTVCDPLPTALGVYVTWQVALLVEFATATSVHGAPLKFPAPFEAKLTVPAGGLGAPVLSVIVAVHVAV